MCYQLCSKGRGASEVTRPGAHQNTLYGIQPFKSKFLSRIILYHNMLKNAYFLKNVKLSQRRGSAPEPPWPPSAGGSALNTPRCYSYLMYSFFEYVSNAKHKLLLLKNISKRLLLLFPRLSFISNTAIFIGEGVKIFLAPGRRLPYS